MGRLARAKIALLERALDGLADRARRRGALRGQPEHLVTGMDGERAAYFHLRRKGFTVVARRWSAGSVPGDIDLIAWDGPTLCFVEVKTRTAHDLTPAEAVIDAAKRTALRRLASIYVRQMPEETAPPVRFDGVSVYLVPGKAKEIQHFANLFGWSEL